jgi:hypothetical protein
MHPEWQVRARREVLDVCGPDELPSKEHLPRLKTVSQSVPLTFLPANFFSNLLPAVGISVIPVTR